MGPGPRTARRAPAAPMIHTRPVRSLGRRSFLHTLAGAIGFGASRRAFAEAPPPAFGADVLASRTPPDLDVLDLTVPATNKLANRFTLYLPKHLAAGERVPLLVLFHGLGETWNDEIGVHAWVQRYGLGNAYARLRRPPVARTSLDRTLLSDVRIDVLNGSLALRPFKGVAVACPFTPNFAKQPDPAAALDAYAAWITDTVIPRARKEAPVFTDAAHTALDGVSLGGYVAAELFVRRPAAFGAFGCVQAAFAPEKLPSYADRIAAAVATLPEGARSRVGVHIQTSALDAMFAVNVSLSSLLAKRGVANDLLVLPGNHDQLYLREAGALEMLLWHDRRPR